MTKEQLSEYEKLHELLQERCKEIWSLLIPVDERFAHLCKIDEINGNVIWGWGEERWSYGGYDTYSLPFLKSFIYESNENIKKYVADVVLEKEEEERKAKEKKESQERKLYEKLKAKYENLN